MKRIAVVCIAVACSLGLFATVAVAETITESPGGNFTATARRTITFDPAGLAISCDITFTGSQTVNRIVTGLGQRVDVGSITGMSGANCSGGATISFLSLPRRILRDWRPHPTIPRLIVILRIIRGWFFSFRIGALTCLWGGEVKFEIDLRGNILLVSSRQSVPLLSGGALCPRPLAIAGTMNYSPTQTITIV